MVSWGLGRPSAALCVGSKDLYIAMGDLDDSVDDRTLGEGIQMANTS